MDNNILSMLSYGMYIVCSEYENKKAGCVVNTLTQISENPDMVAVSIRKQSETGNIIEKSGRFTASILGKNADMDMVGVFGFMSSAETDKFECAPHNFNKNGMPYITSGCLGVISCDVLNVIDVGSHKLYIAKVTEMRRIAEGEVMTYTDYKESKNKKSGWRCTVCGYVYEGEDLPDDFKCPWCNVGVEHFKKI